jgi:hypothetical protein
MKKLYLWLIAFAILTPLGILASGSAWGEWNAQEIKHQVGFAPKGMKALQSVWSGYLAGYKVPGTKGLLLGSIGYIFSAFLAIIIIFLAFKLISFILPDEPNSKGRN